MTYLGMIGPLQWIIILIAVFFWIIPTIIALIDILKSKFNGNDKIVWVLVVLFLNLIGAILYFTIGRKQKLTN
ncbi:MAG: PLD nuclease N-terminal domain-containing protein [Lutibacter sp.]|nr:PLD nuclease N-terminal domain-containing protein [Lutibacter sp.]